MMGLQGWVGAPAQAEQGGLEAEDPGRELVQGG